MKSFARPDFHRDSLGYVRYYDFIRPRICTSLLLAFPYRFSAVSLTITVLVLLFLYKARFRVLAVFMPCGAYPVVRFPVHSYLSRSLPSRFYHSKSYFRHLNDGSLAFNSPALTIRSLVIQPTGYALTLSLSTIAWTTAPQGGLVNTPEQLYR